MKNLKLAVITIAFWLVGNVSNAQAYMEDIAKKACNCLDDLKDTTNKDEYTMRLGLCMIDAASPYQKQLKKDYGIDFKNIDKQGEELGKIIGLKMAAVCPASLMKLVATTQQAESIQEEKSSGKEGVVMEVFEGNVVQIEDNQFVVFAAKNDMGKILKFYWLTFPTANIDMPSQYKSLLNKMVRIAFTQQEIFDPKISEYRAINVIKKIDKID